MLTVCELNIALPFITFAVGMFVGIIIWEIGSAEGRQP